MRQCVWLASRPTLAEPRRQVFSSLSCSVCRQVVAMASAKGLKVWQEATGEGRLACALPDDMTGRCRESLLDG